MKALIFDSGALITFSMNSMLDTLRELKKTFPGKFLITKAVEFEIVKRPLTIKKYKLGALNLKSLIDNKILEFPESVGISSGLIETESQSILKLTNSVFYAENQPIHLIDSGEASTIALSMLLDKKGIKNAIAIDERTTRMLFEDSQKLQSLLEDKFNMKITKKESNLPKIKNLIFIRSSELIYVAYKKGIINKDKELLDAMLYGAKFKGCSISMDEISEIEKLS